MKSPLLIICFLSYFLAGAQHQGFPKLHFNEDATRISEGSFEDEGSFSDNTTFTQPVPPLLNTSSTNLEICTGNSTRLTASSNYKIYWYTTPPPLGSPVGTGTSYITPALTTGYYTYYAVADNNGVKSDFTAMEVVMVYPNPELKITSTRDVICPGETILLSVSGTTSYEWENGATSDRVILSPETTQTFKVTGINTAGCKTTAEFTQLVEPCSQSEAVVTEAAENRTSTMLTGDPPKEEKLFNVFPNPNNGEFNVRVNSISESTKLEVYNSLGQLNYSAKVTSELTSVTLGGYPNGIYIVRIIENDKVLKQQKIVKE